jgi:transcriptional regulator with XRE-family HTH domain
LPASRVYASPQTGLLAWARTSAGLSIEEAARKVGANAEKLSSWEDGESRPTIGQLRKLAHIYKRPIAVFYLPVPPEDPMPPKDYRRLPGSVAGRES